MTRDFSSHWQAAEAVVAQLQSNSFEGYLVGGAVRDILLGAEPKDFDVVTNAKPEQIMALPLFEKAHYKDTAQAFGVTRVRVVVDGAEEEIEIATYRKDVEAHLGRKLTKVEFSHIEDDLQRRDFTINALALDPHSHSLIDLHDGLKDLETKTVRFIGQPDERITEDPLRVLRAIRFRNQLGFEYEEATRVALSKAIRGGVLDSIAVDRVRQELTRMLVHPSRRQAVEDMDALGVVEHFLPELADCKEVAQPPTEHAEGDVWIHSLMAIDALPEQPSPRLAWATLLHDIGKAVTIEMPHESGDRIRFDNHHKAGSELAQKIMLRLNFSKAQAADIVWLVHYHMITDAFPGMKQSRRVHYLSHPAFHDLLDLHAADIRGSIMGDPTASDGSDVIAELEKTWREYRRQSQEKPKTLKSELGVDGDWLMKEFGITEGYEIGRILEQLQDDFVDGDIVSEADAHRRVEELR